MQSWFNYPKFKATNPITGAALAGGLLYFYESGGAYSVPKASYSDGGFATPHTNPVVLDANGEALIYLNGVYDVKLTDSTGVLQWTMEDAEGINAFSYSTWEIDVLTSYGAGVNYTKAAIDAALTALGSVSKYTLVLRSGTWAFVAPADYTLYQNVLFKTVYGTLITSTSTIKFPDGSKFYLSNFSSLQAAIALLSTSAVTLVVDRDYAMTANATVPATMVLEFQNGAQITHTGYTLTINGTVVAGRYQIFAGSGTVSGPTGEVPLEWSGAGTSLSVAAKIESYIVDEDDMASDSATKVPTQQSVKAYVTASAPITVLVGTVICWPLDTPPSGYKECNGDYLDTTTYADLYAVIGDTYGMFDGTHFYLPDYRGMFLRGLDGTRGVEPAADKAARVARGDGTGGNVVGTTQAGGNASHGHAGSTVAMSTALSIGTGSGGATADIAIGSQTGVASTTELTATPTIAVNGGNEARPVNINVLWCIKY